MKRLSSATLAELPETLTRPGFVPAEHAAGIVHLGIGAFHRAHQAVYTDDVLAHSGGDWRIVGVSLRSQAVADQLNPQDGLYTVNVKDETGSAYRVVGAVERVMYAPRDPEAVIGLMADPRTRIVSLTVTEKGYCHDPASGALNFSHPAIVADLENPERPESALGYLVEALSRRRSTALQPFTVLCCDNLPGNGPLVRGLVLELAARRDETLAAWIAEEAAFPATMIDRIVPATTDADREAAAAALGFDDCGLVVTEPFTQWVIEDWFCNTRPSWEDAGAQIVSEVEPFELAKLRLLNGSHSTIAYLGYLGGYDYVHQAMRDPAYRELVRYLMRIEIAPTLTPPEGFDLDRYQQDLMNRFSNPALNHRTYQIAMDGSQKLPQRLLGTVRDRLSADKGFAGLALAVAAWIRYVRGVDEHGARIVVQDPLGEVLAALTRELESSPDVVVRQVLGFAEVFDNDLVEHESFVAEVTEAMHRLIKFGARETVNRFVHELAADGPGGRGDPSS